MTKVYCLCGHHHPGGSCPKCNCLHYVPKPLKQTLEETITSRMEVVDAKHLSIEERQDLINTFIIRALGLEDYKEAAQQPLHWDLLCYCMGMLSYFIVQSCEDTNNVDMITTVKKMNAFIYSIHYSVQDVDEILGPGRGEHEQIWLERLDKLSLLSDHDAALIDEARAAAGEDDVPERDMPKLQTIRRNISTSDN